MATLLVLHVSAYSTHLTHGYYTGVVIGLLQMISYTPLTAPCLSSLVCEDNHNLLARVGNISRKKSPELRRLSRCVSFLSNLTSFNLLSALF